MATPTIPSERIDKLLQYLAGTLVDLEGVAAHWDQEPVHVKQEWSMEWRNDMDTLEFLQEENERGSLTGAQQETLVDLLSWVQRLLPTVEALELDMPRVPLKT